MSLPEDTTFAFQPLQPSWCQARADRDFETWHDTYEALAEGFADDTDTFWGGPNATIHMLNDYGDTYPVPKPHLEVGFMPLLLPGDNYYIGSYWRINVPAPPWYLGGDLYYNALAYGIMRWQMQHIYVAQTFVRTFEFHHYGRKPKAD